MKVTEDLFLACSFDRAKFMEHAFELKADTWQEELLWAMPNKSLLLCSRQAGKSTVCATIALSVATYTVSSLVLIISHTYRQAEETFRKVKAGLWFTSSFVGIKHETQTMLELTNGSRIVALPAKQESIRSFSKVSLLIVDEAAQVADDVYRTIRPMLAVSRGKIIALSTPFGKRGWFYEAWENGVGWAKVKITAYDCPRITDDFIKEEIQEIGEWWVEQEYMCKFVDASDQLFNHSDIIDAISSEVPPLALN